jgi:hypothetical protein
MKLQLHRNILVIFTLVPLLLFSCKKNNTSGNGIADKATYNLKIKKISGSGSSKILVGLNIDSNWDSENGIIWLGNDEKNEPTGTLTLEIGSPYTNTDGEQEAAIGSATLSTQDKIIGTADELNGRTYSFVGMDAYIVIDKIGSNYIEVKKIYIKMDRVLYYNTDLPETIELTGSFTAIVEH